MINDHLFEKVGHFHIDSNGDKFHKLLICAVNLLMWVNFVLNQLMYTLINFLNKLLVV